MKGRAIADERPARARKQRQRRNAKNALPLDPAASAAEHTRQIFRSIEDRLASVGSNKSQIAHITIWLSHLHYFDEVTAVWNEWVDPDHPPVRACAQVALANKDLKVEMIVVAHVPAAAAVG